MTRGVGYFIAANTGWARGREELVYMYLESKESGMGSQMRRIIRRRSSSAR